MEQLLLDAMCGKLATYLRMCGHDTVYTLEEGIEADEEIRTRANSSDRRLVTRDAELAARTEDAILLTARDIDGQLGELLAADIDLCLPEDPTRCSRCNGALAGVAADATTPQYAPDPSDRRVWRCPDCGQHFWTGSHWDDVAERLAAIHRDG